MQLRPGTPEEAGMSPERVQRVKDLARGWVEEGITPSLVVLVARRGVVVIHEAFGVLTPERGSPPLRRDSIFPIASISKPITATAAMILVEDGLLGLNRPVQWYIPEFVGEGKDAVMVHHLLTHTSGLTAEDVDAHAKTKGATEMPPAEPTQHPRVHRYLSARYDAPLTHPAGQQMVYSVFGYDLLGEIVRRVSGQSFPDFTRQRLFEPLGMSDTCWVVPQPRRGRVVQRTRDAPDALLLRAMRAFDAIWPAGGAHSTAIDMATFGQMFLNGGTYDDVRVLSPAAVAAMTKNQIPGVGAWIHGKYFSEATWGLGWNVRGFKMKLMANETLLSPEAFAHGGAGGVALWVDPVDQVVAAYFSVSSHSGVPSGFAVTETSPFGIEWRGDLFINAAMASIVD